MRQRYQKWMQNWETRLTTRDTNRVVRPFEWGVEWARGWPGANGNCPDAGHDATENFFHQLNRTIVVRSDEFFSYRTPTDFRIETSPIKLHAAGGNNGGQDDEELGMGKFLRFTS